MYLSLLFHEQFSILVTIIGDCLHWAMKVAQWFWRRFLNFNDEFLQFCLLFPLEKRLGSSFVQTWISSTQGCFVPSLAEIGWVVVKEKMKMWKIYKQTDRRTDGKTTNDRRSEKLTRAFSTDELKSIFFHLKWCAEHLLIIVIN